MEQINNTTTNVAPAQQGGNKEGYKTLAKEGVIVGASVATGIAAVGAVGSGLMVVGTFIVRKIKSGVEKHRERRAAKKAAKAGEAK